MGLKNSKKKGNLLSHISHNNLDGLRKQLKRKKTDVNSITDPETPLARAVRSSNTAAVSILLDHGADPNCVFHRNYRGTEIFLWTALHEACRGSRKRVVCGQWRALRSQDPQEKEATENYDPTILKLLLEKKVNVNQGVHFGLTPLHIAAWHGNVTAVELLLKAGCDINKLDDFHESALSIAVCHGDAPMVDLLLNAGCKLNSRSWGSTWCRSSYYGIQYDFDQKNFDDFVNRTIKERLGRPGPYSMLTIALPRWPAIAQQLIRHGADTSQIDVLVLCGEQNDKQDFTPFVQMLHMTSLKSPVIFTSHTDRHSLPMITDLSAPSSLKNQCRIATRKILARVSHGLSLVQRVYQLPIPKTLQEYLDLNDCSLCCSRPPIVEAYSGCMCGLL